MEAHPSLPLLVRLHFRPTVPRNIFELKGVLKWVKPHPYLVYQTSDPSHRSLVIFGSRIGSFPAYASSSHPSACCCRISCAANGISLFWIYAFLVYWRGSAADHSPDSIDRLIPPDGIAASILSLQHGNRELISSMSSVGNFPTFHDTCNAPACYSKRPEKDTKEFRGSA